MYSRLQIIGYIIHFNHQIVGEEKKRKEQFNLETYNISFRLKKTLSGRYLYSNYNKLQIFWYKYLILTSFWILR